MPEYEARIALLVNCQRAPLQEDRRHRNALFRVSQEMGSAEQTGLRVSEKLQAGEKHGAWRRAYHDNKQAEEDGEIERGYKPAPF